MARRSAFPLDRDIDLCLDGLQRFEEANAWQRVGGALRDAAAVLEGANPGVRIPDVTVLLVLGDPTSWDEPGSGCRRSRTTQRSAGS